jgi:hypothetical protein
VPATMFPNKKVGNFMARRETDCQLPEIGFDGAWCLIQLGMLPCLKVNWESKFVADCNHTPRDVSAGDGAQIPGIYEQKNGFKGNTSRIGLVHHDTQSCIEVAVEVLNNH